MESAGRIVEPGHQRLRERLSPDALGSSARPLVVPETAQEREGEADLLRLTRRAYQQARRIVTAPKARGLSPAERVVVVMNTEGFRATCRPVERAATSWIAENRTGHGPSVFIPDDAVVYRDDGSSEITYEVEIPDSSAPPLPPAPQTPDHQEWTWARVVANAACDPPPGDAVGWLATAAFDAWCLSITDGRQRGALELRLRVYLRLRQRLVLERARGNRGDPPKRRTRGNRR